MKDLPDELLMAIGELSAAMGCPAVGGRFPKTIESETVRLAAQRLREAQAVESSTAEPSEPVYHLRQYGDVSKSQLDYYAKHGTLDGYPFGAVAESPEAAGDEQWFSIQRVRPAPDRKVLATDGDRWFFAYLSSDETRWDDWRYADNSILVDRITHWMPLPPLPTGAMKFQVDYFYLATGMEGRADRRDYGTVEANSADEAVELVASREPTEELRNWMRGCLTARPTPAAPVAPATARSDKPQVETGTVSPLLSDEQILRAFIEKVPAAWFKPEWHGAILEGLRAVIAAHQQPK